MTKCYIGLGSNLGDRITNLERAAASLKAARASFVYETAALMPQGAPSSWNIPFLNAVIEISWAGTPRELLDKLKQLEREMGRMPLERWAPRVIDLDILLFGNQRIQEEGLKIPHPEMQSRSFVLDPLKDLLPEYSPKARACRGHSPLWMGILNLTPDSFSDGGKLLSEEALAQKIAALDGAAYFDIGGESTRPGATAVTPDEEWARISPALKFLRGNSRAFRPRISIDTRYALTAERALELGADLINDVSGLADPRMASLVKQSGCEYVLMHSLSVPADGKITIPGDIDPVRAILQWAVPKLEQLEKAGVKRERIIFDPGVGFGKTASQSIELVSRVEEFFALGCRTLVGHSRKGFLNTWGERPAHDRDWESAGVSLRLASAGVDIIRVHEPLLHARAYRAFQGVAPCPPSV